MNGNASLPGISCLTAFASVFAVFNQENVMAWVMLAINIATLITNCGISIYRKIRDRDKDLEERKGEDDHETLPRA